MRTAVKGPSSVRPAMDGPGQCAYSHGSEGQEHAGGSVGGLPRTRRRSVHDSRNLSRAPAASLRDRLRRPVTEPVCRMVRQLSGSGEGPGTGRGAAGLPEAGRELARGPGRHVVIGWETAEMGDQGQRLTATAAANRCHQRPPTAHNSRTIRANWGYVRPEKQTVGDQRRGAATVAKTVAKPLNSTRRTWTTLEYQPSLRPVTDGPGRCAHSYGSDSQGFVPSNFFEQSSCPYKAVVARGSIEPIVLAADENIGKCHRRSHRRLASNSQLYTSRFHADVEPRRACLFVVVLIAS